MRTTLSIGRLVLRINWLIALCVVFAVSGLVRLGVWQLSRANDKISQLESYQQAAGLAATPLMEVPIAGLPFDMQQHQNRLVSLKGRYLNEQPIFLIYQTFESQIGWEVVTPFQLEGQELIALVSRGWSGIGSPEELATALPAYEESLELQGQLFVPTASQAGKSNGRVEPKWPLVLRYLNQQELAPMFDQPLFPYVVRLMEGQTGVLVRHWPAVTVDSGRNFSYALQWFAMAIAVVLVSLILSSNLLQLWSSNSKAL